MFALPEAEGVVARPTTVNEVPETVNFEPTVSLFCEAYPESSTATSAFASAAARLRPLVMLTVDSGPIVGRLASTPSRVIGCTPTLPPAVGAPPPLSGPACLTVEPLLGPVPCD